MAYYLRQDKKKKGTYLQMYRKRQIIPRLANKRL